MYKRKLHNKISSGLLILIAAFSLTACGSSGDSLEIPDTESVQAEQTGQETATDTQTTSQTTPETTSEPEPEKLTYQTGLYQEKTLSDQISADAVRELPEGEYGVLSYSYDETVSVWGNGAEDCLVIHDGDREYRVISPGKTCIQLLLLLKPQIMTGMATRSIIFLPCREPEPVSMWKDCIM